MLVTAYGEFAFHSHCTSSSGGDTERVYWAYNIQVETKICNRMTASVLKQDPKTKRFKRTLDMATQDAHFRVNPLYQATKLHLNNR